MFLDLIDFLEQNKKNDFVYIKDHFNGSELENVSKEDIRDYYYRLGRADISDELLWMIYPVYGRRIVDAAKVKLIDSPCERNENCLDRYLRWLSCEGGRIWLLQRNSRERMIKYELHNNYYFYTIIKNRGSQELAALSTSW